jgi:FkbM family methyltransferase
MSVFAKCLRVLDGVNFRLRRNLWLLRNARDLRSIWVMKGKGIPLSPELVRFRFFNNPLLIRPRTTDSWAAWDLLFEEEYAPIAPLPVRTVVDCGANVGMFLAFLLKYTRGELQRYVGVEPDAASFEILRRQVELFGVRDKATLLQLAVSDREGVLTFDDSGPVWEHHVSPTGTKQVQAAPLPRILDTAGIEVCDLLKVDIEGAEKELFESIGQWKDRVRAIVCELHANVSYEWFAGLMRSAGFNPYRSGSLFRKLPGAIRSDLDSLARS